MNIETFWDLVTKLNWKNNHNYAANKAYILKNHSPKEVKELNSVYSSLYNALAQVLSKSMNESKYSVGNDSFSDLCAEIVGRGKYYYEQVMQDPSIAQEMIKNSDYNESFSYSFPYQDDYEKLSPNYYMKSAQSHLRTVNEIDWTRFNKDIQNLKQRYESLIISSLEQYNFKHLIEKEYEIIGLQTELEKLTKESLHWELRNSISDYKVFMV